MAEKDLKNIEKIIKALADESRIRIICLLKSKSSLCVCEIQGIIGLSQPTISSHLKILENAGLIEFTKDGLWVNYKIKANLNSFEIGLIESISKSLIRDTQIKSDLSRIKTINRLLICQKNQ